MKLMDLDEIRALSQEELKSVIDELWADFYNAPGKDGFTALMMAAHLEPFVEYLFALMPVGPEREVIESDAQRLFDRLEALHNEKGLAQTELERVTCELKVLKTIMSIRALSLGRIILAFKAELKLQRAGYVRENDYFLWAACIPIIQFQEGTAKDFWRNGRNTGRAHPGRTRPRKTDAFCVGYYWDEDGKLQEDKTRTDQQRLQYTRETAEAIIEYFERTRGRTRGAKSFAMELLGIQDVSTLNTLLKGPKA